MYYKVRYTGEHWICEGEWFPTHTKTDQLMKKRCDKSGMGEYDMIYDIYYFRFDLLGEKFGTDKVMYKLIEEYIENEKLKEFLTKI